MKEAMKYLGEFMSDAITNFRYLGLEAMKRIALLSSAELDANDKSNGLTSTQGLSLEQYQEKVIIVCVRISFRSTPRYHFWSKFRRRSTE
jgi:hypothetical protein